MNRLEQVADAELRQRMEENQLRYIENFRHSLWGRICFMCWKMTGKTKQYETEKDLLIQAINTSRINNRVTAFVMKLRAVKYRMKNKNDLSFREKRSDRLAVAAIVKNEGSYIGEWIEFHLKAGVDHFYIFDNGSTDATLDILKSYEGRGIVTVFHYHGNMAQVFAYNEALKLCRKTSEWLAFIDADEFLFSPSGKNLKEVLKEYEEAPAVGVNWIVYGPCGHEKKPEGAVTSNYALTFEDKNNELNCRIKSIVRPKETLCICSPHFGVYKHGRLAVDENHEIISGGAAYVADGRACTYRNSANSIRINHYWTKSLEELREKCARGYADGTANPEYQKILNRLDHPLTEDRTIEVITEK